MQQPQSSHVDRLTCHFRRVAVISNRNRRIPLEQTSLTTNSVSEIMECTARIHSASDLNEVLATATKCVARLAGSEVCFCFFQDTGSGDIVFREAYGPDACKPAIERIRPAQGIAGWVVQYGKPVMVQDVHSDPRFDAGVDECSQYPAFSILAVPIVHSGKTIGVFEAINKPRKGQFSREDAFILSHFADQVAIAVKNTKYSPHRNQASKSSLILKDGYHETIKERAIERMSVGIAHNFKNVLNAIVGFAEIILIDTKEESVRKGIQGIRNACDSALDLVNQLEAFTEKHHPKKKPVNIQRLFKQTLKLFRLRLPETVSVHQEISEKSITLLGDSARLHRAIMSLLKNAYESFRGHSGSVAVQYEVVEITTETVDLFEGLETGTYAKLVIRDNGCGMDQETVDQIFDPYFSTKKGGVGTGIGLSLVKRIIREHDGDITISSIPREGTTVEVYLPSAASEPAGQLVTGDQLPRGNEKILVIDDEELLTSILARMLTSMGYHVTKVNSSRQALEVYRDSHVDVDLVITDWAMPEITGDRLAEKMKQINPAVKVILASAFDEEIDKEHLKSCGIQYILKKPIAMKELAVAVRNTLDANS